MFRMDSGMRIRVLSDWDVLHVEALIMLLLLLLLRSSDACISERLSWMLEAVVEEHVKRSNDRSNSGPTSDRGGRRQCVQSWGVESSMQVSRYVACWELHDVARPKFRLFCL
jgi:hypothetical protein